MTYCNFFIEKNLKRPLDLKLPMRSKRTKVAEKVAGDPLSKGDFRWMGVR